MGNNGMNGAGIKRTTMGVCKWERVRMEISSQQQEREIQMGKGRITGTGGQVRMSTNKIQQKIKWEVSGMVGEVG